MPEVLIETLGLSRIFHRDSTEIGALEDITLKVFSGDFINLMGPSGSGKSTLLNIMAGIDKPSGGELRIQDFEVASMSDDELAEWRNQHVGFVFQNFNLIPVPTAFENVELLIASDQSVQEGATRTRRDLLNLVGLADRMEHYPRQLSGGQEQRVAIARAIVTDPTFILADEPTGDLDAGSAKEALDVLAALNQDYGKTIIMVTHDPKAAAYALVKHYLEKGLLSVAPE